MSENADIESKGDGKKIHRQPRAGRKAMKKKNKSTHVQELTAKERNPKAFAINSAIRAERKFRRHQDLDTKKQHVPLVDRTPIEPPPIVVAVVGPPKVGKTTLVRCLIRNFTRQPMTSVRGPVTIVSGKRRRITLIECNNDINSMIDIAKVADLVFLLIDGSFGFEMEIFEFLNICQVHGMPKIMGILTHLDMLKNNKLLKQTKKVLKHRFWTEVYPGAKLFYLSTIIHGDYLRNEIERLGRFISVMKFRPVAWRTSHPYILVDRMEDLTSPESIRQNPKCERNVSLYGFVRGIPLNVNNSIHISGCADFRISDICYLPDPCPLPDRLKKRSLVDKEKLLYAPFSGVGGIVYDKDAVYVEIPGKHSKVYDESRTEQQLFTSLVDAKETLDTKLAHSEVQLFSNTQPITGDEFTQANLNEAYFVETIVCENDGRKRRKITFSDTGLNDVEVETDDETDSYQFDVSEEDDSSRSDENYDFNDEDAKKDTDTEDCHVKGKKRREENEPRSNENVVHEEITAVRWKENLSQKAADAFIARQNLAANLWTLVYDNEKENKNEPVENDEEVGGLFKKISEKTNKIAQEKDIMNVEDCSRFLVTHIRDWNDHMVASSIKDCFITGTWKSEENASELLKLNDVNSDEEGDFEDLETGTTYGGQEKQNIDEKSKREMTKDELIEKKRKLKKKFDAEYDENGGEGGTYYDELKQEASKQAQLNKMEFEDLDDDLRVQLEGFRPGMYVRIELHDVPCELITNFDPTYPIVVGGLQPGEENIGFVNVRLKKHRWYQKILKTKDPIIISLGWRKFQTLPVYYRLEDNFRQRMLKYTPEHATCMATFWGPLTKLGTGFLAIQDMASRQEGFRIIATGTIVAANQSTQITKKLKLIGEPLKIFKKTAFIKNMFSSTLEVAKFEGARIKTASGIRGQIKRACSKPEGAFRATFEDCIKLSDIIFCRTWCSIDVPRLYNPVVSLLLPSNEKALWRGMKTTGQLKREKGVKCDPQADSLYRPVIRKKKIPKPIKIPKRLQRELPFKDKPKTSSMGHATNIKKQRIAVIRDRHEQKIAALMKKIRINFRDKQGKQRREMKNRVRSHRKEMKAVEHKKIQKEKERRKQLFTKQTKREARRK